jgi:hypothetical protein
LTRERENPGSWNVPGFPPPCRLPLCTQAYAHRQPRFRAASIRGQVRAAHSHNNRGPPADSCRQLARGSRRRWNRHSRAGRGDGRSSRGTDTRRARRTRWCSGSHGIHRRHRSGRAVANFAVAVRLDTVLTAGTAELGSGVTVRVQVAIGVGVGAVLRPGDRRPAPGAANVAAATRLTMILFIRSPHCSGSLFSHLGTFAAFAPLHLLEKMAKPPKVHRPTTESGTPALRTSCREASRRSGHPGLSLRSASHRARPSPRPRRLVETVC